MTAVKIGRITPRGKVHLALDGQIADNHLRGVVYPVSDPGAVEAKRLCRRCFTPDRVGRAQRLLTTATGLVVEGIRRMLADVVGASRTPAERTEVEDLAARIRDDLRASGVLRPVGEGLAVVLAHSARLAPAVQALPVDERLRTWKTLRDEFVTTHPQAA